ncbi:hypothetical protein K438DRAFT_2101384 [Mycena galopus ATCC 62051]|nr:hypothetical protein K438DRAFT_2101384 [Mycena galopus ATCC 62051]
MECVMTNPKQSKRRSCGSATGPKNSYREKIELNENKSAAARNREEQNPTRQVETKGKQKAQSQADREARNLTARDCPRKAGRRDPPAEEVAWHHPDRFCIRIRIAIEGRKGGMVNDEESAQSAYNEDPGARRERPGGQMTKSLYSASATVCATTATQPFAQPRRAQASWGKVALRWHAHDTGSRARAVRVQRGSESRNTQRWSRKRTRGAETGWRAGLERFSTSRSDEVGPDQVIRTCRL